jgi:hypothetical protein
MMARKSKHHQPSLFDEETPLVKPCPARRGELAGLVEALLREIAATLRRNEPYRRSIAPTAVASSRRAPHAPLPQGLSAACVWSAGIAISMDGKGAWGQRVHRAVVAQRQIRGGVSEGLRQRQRGALIDRPLS